MLTTANELSVKLTLTLAEERVCAQVQARTYTRKGARTHAHTQKHTDIFKRALLFLQSL